MAMEAGNSILATPLIAGPEPKHAQLRDRIVSMSVAGQAIPSERELMVTYQVSRATVRKAIDGLVADGLLERIHGLGTFAVRPRIETDLHLASFTQDMRRRGLVPSTCLLSVELAVPRASVASAIGLTLDGKAWRVRRLRLADDQPMAVEDGWYPESLMPDLDRHNLAGSLYTLLESAYGLRIDDARQVLWTEAAGTELSTLLGVALHAPLLAFERTSRADGRPVEHVLSYYRGDRYQVHMDLHSS